MVMGLEFIERVAEFAAMAIAAEMYLNPVETMVVLTVIATDNIIYALMDISAIVFEEKHVKQF